MLDLTPLCSLALTGNAFLAKAFGKVVSIRSFHTRTTIQQGELQESLRGKIASSVPLSQKRLLKTKLPHLDH